MKHFLLFCFFFLLCANSLKAQTYANIPGPENVLVVYKQPSGPTDTLGWVSDSVMQYYVTARGIPAANVVGLDSLFDKLITFNGVTHNVIIDQETDKIRDENNFLSPTFHAWKYYLTYVANPIKDYLTSTIRYIVLCKGVPFKIQANGDWSAASGNLTVDGLLCMLNTDNYGSFIENTIYPNHKKTNPYFGKDPNLTMDYRFLPDHFNGYDYNLSYLITHLDGLTFDIVKGIIDRSIDPDMSGTATWVLDDDPTFLGSEYFNNTRDKLEGLGFNVAYDFSNNWITSFSDNVMGYTSWGTHAEDGNCSWEDSAWVVDSLHFNLSNGSVFNTIESFNGNSLTTLKWRYVYPDTVCNHTQGLATQFTQIGGTGTMGHAWEPGLSGVVDNSMFFPGYAIGYNYCNASDGNGIS